MALEYRRKDEQRRATGFGKFQCFLFVCLAFFFFSFAKGVANGNLRGGGELKGTKLETIERQKRGTKFLMIQRD